MRRIRGLIALATASMLCLAGVGPAAEAAVKPPPAAAEPSADLAPGAAAAVLMDAASGRVLWQKNEHSKRPVASITKLMTMAFH